MRPLQIILFLTLCTFGTLGFSQEKRASIYTIHEIENKQVNLEINTYVLRPATNLSEDLDVTVFPNPFENILNIKFDEILTQNYYVRVFDLNSRLILEFEHQPSVNTLTLSNLEPGTYIVDIQTNSKRKVFKLIKNNL